MPYVAAMNASASDPPPARRRGLSVVTLSTLEATEVDDAGLERGSVERDLHLNSRTYWYRDGAGDPVIWACRILEHLHEQMTLPAVLTVVEPPSDAFLHTFLHYPYDHAEPHVAECGHLSHHEDTTPNGKFFDAAQPARALRSPWDEDDGYDLMSDPDLDPPRVTADERGERRAVSTTHHCRLWLVGGGWTAEDAEAIEQTARVDGPFHVFGPGDTIRPAHPWDPAGNLS